MTENVLNIIAFCLLKLLSGLTGNYHAIRHYSYNLPLIAIMNNLQTNE